MFKSKILFLMSGSIAAFKACEVISALSKEGHDVQVVCTKSTFEFVGAATLEGLTGRSPQSDLFAEGEMMNHIHWARWADVILLCPASANTIAQMAQGLAPDLVSTIYLAWDRRPPFFVAPAMNQAMWTHPAVQANLQTLQTHGVRILAPGDGALACGEAGPGRLMEPAQILASITVNDKTTQAKNILITCGATRESVDSIRFLTNFSTGKTGLSLAERLAGRGHNVTCLRGQATPEAALIVGHQEVFSSTQDLGERLRRQLGAHDFDVVIHAAAVSDFHVSAVLADGGAAQQVGQKLRSDQSLTLELRQNPKLITQLREWSKNKNVRLVGFKLTRTDDLKEREQAIDRLMSSCRLDAVVANDLADISATGHAGWLYPAGKDRAPFKNKLELFTKLDQWIEKE